MKFTSTILAFGLIVFAAAQSTTTSAPAASVTPSEQEKCVVSCKGDLKCTAECMGNPAPSEEMVNATTQCAMKCVQGNGTEEETKKYAECQQKCIQENFFVNPSGASGVVSRASATSTGGTATRTSSPSSSGTADDADASSAPNAAGHLAVSGAAGVLALLVAAVAL